MSLTDGQSHSHASGHDPRTGRFMSHNTAYRTRQTRLLALMERLKASYDVDNPADLALLSIAALHLCDAETARSRNARVRATNAASRLLKNLPSKEREPSLDEVLR